MLEVLLKIAFYLAAGFFLVVAGTWYFRSLYDAIHGTGEVVIVPFAVVGGDEDKDNARGIALARMLQAHLQEIESDLAMSQRELMEERDVPRRLSSPEEQSSTQIRTALIPRLFVAQGASLETKLLEPAQINVAVGGVQVGGIVPWLQRILANHRSLEFSFYDGDTKVSVAGSLQVLNMPGESLRVELPKANGSKVDWNDVTAEVAYEIVRRRLAGDPSNRVQVLNTGEFRVLVGVMHEIAKLNRSAALGRPVRGGFAGELQKIEPLVRGVREWYQLNALAASIAESADDKVKALDFYRNVRDALKKTLETPDLKGRAEVQKAFDLAAGKITELEKHSQVAATLTESAVLEKIRDDARAAADAYNQIFGVQLQPPTVELLPRNERNAFFDGKILHAPPAAAKIPDLTHHDASWQYLEKYVPLFDGTLGDQASVIMYSYSDILPMLLKQRGLAGLTASQDWTLYEGGVAWLKGGDEKAIAADRRPMRSFIAPGKAYDDAEFGKDPQIANIKDFSSDILPQSACGIGNKAFYEAAQALGLDRAWEIWFEALKQVSKEKPITFRKWGASLLTAAGADREKLVGALKAVGLTPHSEAVVGDRRRK